MEWIRFLFLAVLKTFGYLLYPASTKFIGEEKIPWQDVSLILILNHTSLFEFVYGVVLPFRYLWKLSNKLVIPVAEDTLKNPISGCLFRNLSPKTISITRKRDSSWQHFLDNLEAEDICIFMPEGQMKRPDGLNKYGEPMKVKGGVADLLEKYRGKNMVIVYSKGLHHILAPGQWIPKCFKKIEAKLEFLPINSYLDQFSGQEPKAMAIASDLQRKRDLYC